MFRLRGLVRTARLPSHPAVRGLSPPAYALINPGAEESHELPTAIPGDHDKD